MAPTPKPTEDVDQVRDATTNLSPNMRAACGQQFRPLLNQPKITQDLIKLVLQLMAVAFRPLKVSSLLKALTVQSDIETSIFTDEEDLRTLIEKNLPVVGFKPDGTVFFLRHTTREFLTLKNELWNSGNKDIIEFRIEPAIAHGLMAIRCLDMLQSTTATVDGDAVCFSHGKDDFAIYAAESWVEHLSLSRAASHSTIDSVNRFMCSEQAVYWLKECLQAQTKIAVSIGKLVVLEHKLKRWANSAVNHREIQSLVEDCVQRLYSKWHRKLLLKYGEGSDYVLQSSNLLGQMLTNKGIYEEASAIFTSTVTIAGAKSDKGSIIYLYSLAGLAQVRQFQGNWEGAISLYTEAVDGFKTHLSQRDPVTLTYMGMLGSAMLGAARHRLNTTEEETLAEAETILTESLDARTVTLGPMHPDTLDGLQTLAKLYSFQNRYELSRDTFYRHHELTKKVLGTEHRNYQQSMDDLGVLYQRNDKLDEAQAVLELVLASHQAVQGEKHPDTAWSKWRLGVLMREQGNFERAIECFKPLEEISGDTYGSTHRYCLMSKYQLGISYASLRQDALARPLLEYVVKHCDFTNKASLEMGQKSAQTLEETYERMGDPRKAKRMRQRSWNLKQGQKTERKTSTELRWIRLASQHLFDGRIILTLLVVTMLWIFLSVPCTVEFQKKLRGSLYGK